MVVRVRIRVKVDDLSSPVALANSGYEAEIPQLMLHRLAPSR